MRWLSTILLLFIIACSGDKPPDTMNIPSPVGMVNDFAKLLKPEEVSNLNYKLIGLKQQNITEIAIVTVTQLDGYSALDLATTYGIKWGVGKREVDNGVVLLITPEKHKVALATGYGTQSRIPDSRAKRITDMVYKSYKENDLYNGIDKAIDLIAVYMKKE